MKMPPIAIPRFNFLARNGAIFNISNIVNPMPTPQDVADANTRNRSQFNVVVRNAKYSNEYNCHGLTFVAKLGWFDEVDRLLVAHDYHRIALVSNFEIDVLRPDHPIVRGDVIVYRDGTRVTHSGVVWALRTLQTNMYITVLSKWGRQSEYFHRHDKVDVNAYGRTIEVWTDREV